MTVAPPLGICTGTVEPGVAFGGFGPVSPFMWRGACIGGCGWRPGCAEEYPAPECLDCARARHGLGDAYLKRGRWAPSVAPERWSWRPWNRPVTEPVNLPVKPPVTVLRPATELSPHDPSLPRGVRQLVELADADRARVTLAIACDADGRIVASLAVRVRGVGHVVYERTEGGAWRFAGGSVLAPRPRHRLPARMHRMRANVGRFTAALLGREYDPTPVLDVAEPVRAAASKGRCPGCGAEVSLTKAGAVYASHKCQTRAIEGRS